METYKLKYPITYKIAGEETVVEELKLRRLTGADMRIMDDFQGKPIALTLKLIDRVATSDHPKMQQISDLLDIEDVNGVGEWLAPMLLGSPQIGATG